MTLYFPNLHPDLLPGVLRQALPADVRFLDPGLAKADSPDHVLPEAAPFDRRLARAILADTLRFGESVADGRDIAVHGLLQQAQALSPESGRQVQAEVERTIAGGVGPDGQTGQPGAPAGALLEARRQAQTLLLLAWNLEERMLDLRGIDAGLRASWARLGQSVSEADTLAGALAETLIKAQPEAQTDADEEGQADHESMAVGKVLAGLTLPDAFAEALPWRRLLEAFVLLAPGQELVTADEAIIAALLEAGLVAAQGVFTAPAWKLAGLDRCPAARPWLDAPMRLACVGAAQGGA